MQLCEMTQIGRIGNIKEVGKNLMISVASNRSYKKDGEWVDKANWIEHTVFGREEKRIAWIKENLAKGDLVFVRSTPGQTNYERNGETIYGMTFALEDIQLLAALAEKEDAGKAKKTKK